jgi:hypothetical protein
MTPSRDNPNSQAPNPNQEPNPKPETGVCGGRFCLHDD